MPAIRRSTQLTAYQASMVYEVPAGKSASVSVAMVNPRKLTLFVQKTTVTPALSLSSPTAYTIAAYGDVYNGPVNLKIDNTAVPYKVTAATTVWPATLAANAPLTIQYQLGAVLNPESGTGTILGGVQASLVYKNFPLIDYQADLKKNNVAFAYSPTTSANHFFMRPTLIGAYTISTTYNAASGYSSGTTSTTSGAGYDGCGIAVLPTGSTYLYTNTLSTATLGSSFSQNYTTEMGGSSPYYMAAGATAVREIVIGSPQIFFVNGVPYWWCSSWAVGSPPMMCCFSIDTMKTSVYTPWQNTAAAAFTGAVNGEKIYWARYCDADGKFYAGTSANKIYVSSTAAFNATSYMSVTGSIPADVDVTFPPIRFAANKLAFRSIAGGGFWEMGMATTPTWTNVTGYNNTTSYVAEPNLSGPISTAGITVIHQDNVGDRVIDKRLWTVTNKYTVNVPYDSRDVTSDLMQKVNINAERTNLVLEAGDKLHAVSEKTGTIVHVTGFED